jgi:hypothetical protein
VIFKSECVSAVCKAFAVLEPFVNEQKVIVSIIIRINTVLFVLHT